MQVGYGTVHTLCTARAERAIRPNSIGVEMVPLNESGDGGVATASMGCARVWLMDSKMEGERAGGSGCKSEGKAGGDGDGNGNTMHRLLDGTVPCPWCISSSWSPCNQLYHHYMHCSPRGSLPLLSHPLYRLRS